MNFARIADMHELDIGAISSSIFVATAELACAAADNAVGHFARPAAGVFLIVALAFAWCVARYDLRRAPGECAQK